MRGKHFIADCCGGEIAAVTSRDRIAAFIEELVPAIGMKAHGEPQIVHFAEYTPEAAGHTLIQLIKTSSITAHFVDQSGDFYLEVFSCKDFEEEIILETIRKYFHPAEIQHQTLRRQA